MDIDHCCYCTLATEIFVCEDGRGGAGGALLVAGRGVETRTLLRIISLCWSAARLCTNYYMTSEHVTRAMSLIK